MKKIGFTLAEILITFAIIGVIAALTLPAIQVNVQKHTAATSMSKAINTLRNINDVALQENDARTLEEILKANNQSNTQYFEYIMQKYMEYEKQTRTKKYKNFDAITDFADINQKTYGYHTKDGITYYRPANSAPKDLGNVTHLSKGYSGKYYEVYVDTNGQAKGPNAMGKDVFKLIVDTKGVVMPYGGFAYNAYTNGGGVLWQSKCIGKTVTDGATCSGSVVDNGYKVTYQY